MRGNAVGSVDTMWQGCLFSGGEFRSPAGGGTIGVRDKASGEIFATAGLAKDADVDAAA
jgi:benzaldehyde dehydrogenase (NAD)